MFVCVVMCAFMRAGVKCVCVCVCVCACVVCMCVCVCVSVCLSVTADCVCVCVCVCDCDRCIDVTDVFLHILAPKLFPSLIDKKENEEEESTSFRSPAIRASASLVHFLLLFCLLFSHLLG